MNKILKSITFTGLLWTGLTAACNLPLLPGSAVDAGSPTPAAASATTPAETALPASPTPEFAPFCEPGGENDSPPAQCRMPIAEESSVFCTNKNPYNLILINDGAVYKVQTMGFWCSDAGMKDDRQMVTCSGPMAGHFEVSVCDPACAVPTVQAEIVQCPQDYYYSSLQGCCTQELQQSLPNCVVLKLKTKTCVVNCSVFTKKSTCNENSIACVWDGEARVCRLRE
jgi:hypothetical protein